MLRGWHANNGVSLGNPKLGFVCTKQSVDGQDGLEGYYYEYDHALDVDQRLVFARHLEAPMFDANQAPALPVSSWPKPRLEKAYRNYAMEYVRTAAPVAVQLFGPEDAGYLLHLTGKLIGMQYFDEIARGFGSGRGSAKEFDAFMFQLLEAQEDVAENGESHDVYEIIQLDLEADGRCARLSSGLRQGARRIDRRSCRRLWPGYRGRYQAGRRRRAAIRLVRQLRRHSGASATPAQSAAGWRRTRKSSRTAPASGFRVRSLKARAPE
jgi:hypothetical protein